MAEGELLYIGTQAGLLVAAAGGAAPWRELRRALDGHDVLALTALDADTLLAAVAGRAPQQSFDGGRSWSDAPGAPVAPLGLRVATSRGPLELANPRLMGATAYARIGGPPVLLGAGAGGGLLFRSEDDGIHWEPAGAPVAGRVTAIAPAARAGGAWAATDTGQILRSADRGVSWREVARVGAAARCLAAVRANLEADD
jgi:hypothetical protein